MGNRPGDVGGLDFLGTDMKGHTEWTLGWNKPNESGWYAIAKCWDMNEGVLSDAAEWTGEKWNWRSRAVITAWAGPFVDYLTAKNWARDHDIEEMT